MYSPCLDVHFFFEFVEVCFVFGGDEDTGRGGGIFHANVVLHLCEVVVADGALGEVVVVLAVVGVVVNLVEDIKYRLFLLCDFGDSVVDGLQLLLKIRMADVVDDDENVSLCNLVEGGFETLKQIFGQLTDEAHSVGEQERQIFYHDLADCGV